MWFQWVTDEWTWLYIASQNIWLGVIIYCLFTKYGDIKFGGPDSKPEFSKLQWFGMMYTCGVAVGLFYFGVAEPMWHFHGWGGARWMDPDMNDNEKATHALMVTYFHWGVHGWIPYVLIGSLLGIMSYRRGLPMTMRSCFYPLWGKQIQGWRGDVVDILSVVCTLFGVCTSLGLGVRQLNKGLVRLDRGTYMGSDYFGGEYDTMLDGRNGQRKNACHSKFVQKEPCTHGRWGIDFDVKTQCTIVVLVTLIATCSVAVGLKRGIAVLSYVAFGMGMLLILSVLFMEDTMAILDNMTTAFGYYLWYLPKISWETDGWARFGGDNTWEGSPGAGGIATQGFVGGPDGAGADYSRTPDSSAPGWMHEWTIFYWGWWISWGPFCGTFLAKISKGRTLREFITYALIVPTLYCILWFGVLGGAGLNMQFKAMRNTDDFDCGFAPHNVDGEDSKLSTQLHSGGMHAKHNQAYTVNLWCLDTEDVLFDQLGSYGGRGLSYALTGFAWICLLLYFITSSDSGSLVIDMLGANGEQDPPLMQRIFWAFTEGAAACAMLKGSGGDPERALKALRAVSVVCGLPFTIMLMYMSHALYIAVLEEAGDLDENRQNWRAPPVLGLPKADEVGEWVRTLLTATVAPFVSIWKVLTQVEGSTSGAEPIMSKEKTTLLWTVLSGVFFYGAILLLIGAPWEANLRMISGAFYLAFASIVAYTRYMTRTGLGIKTGDAMTDCCIAVLFYPLALAQCEKECELGTVGGAAPHLGQEKAKVSEA